MKKLLALVLSMVMALSLTAPAFAAAAPGEAPVDGDPGFFTENGLPVPIYNPGDPIPISLEPDEFLPEAVNDAVIGIIGGADGPTAIITTTIPSGWANTNPEFDQAYQEMYQAMIDAQKEALGGVPGQIGVMFNGEYVQFPDAAPETVNGCTMAPVRALVEALGGEVESIDDKIVCKTDSVRLTFILGRREVLVEYLGVTGQDSWRMFPLDCATFIKGGRAYVPVRLISEVLGCEVGWDGAYQTVILLDRDALVEKIDQNFTILNRVQANRIPAVGNGKSLQSETKGTVTVTAFDTLNGGKTYQADLSGKTLMNFEAASGTYSFTLSDNAVEDLEKLLTDMYGEAFEEDALLVRTVVDGLKKMEVIMTAEGLVWAHAPILDELSGEENTWAAMDLGRELNTLLSLQMNANQLTIGTAVIGMIGPNSVAKMAAVSQTVQAMADLYGDKKFTTSNGVSTRTIGLSELAALSGVDVSDVKDAFKTYKVTMKVDGNGSVTSSCTMETKAQDYVPAVKITMDAAQSADKASVTMTCHIANMGEMKLELTSTQKAVSAKPASQPPKDATIIEADSPAPLNR